MCWIDTLDSSLMFIGPYLLSADYVLKSNLSLQAQQTTLNSYQWEHILYKHKEKSYLSLLHCYEYWLWLFEYYRLKRKK